MNIPKQCLECMNYKTSKGCCDIYDYLVGEGDRSNVVECPSLVKRGNEESLKLLAEYIDQDDAVIDQALSRAVNRILNGYAERMKVMVIGIARRKIKSIIKMTDVVDKLLDRVDNDDLNLTPSQSIRLLAELNNSINTDLSFIMKLIQPDSSFKDIQMYFDQRTLNIQNNGASEATNKAADDLMRLSSTSRENIRGAFDIILKTLQSERTSTDPVTISQEFVESSLDPLSSEGEDIVE